MAQPGPNPQTNLIISIVAPVVALIAIAVMYFTKPVITAPAAPTPVNTTAAKLPDPGVVPANALPGAGNSGTGGAQAGMGGGTPFGAGGAGTPGAGRSAKPMGGRAGR